MELSKDAVFFIDAIHDSISLLVKAPAEIDAGMAILNRKIYFASGAHLWESK